MLIIENFDQVTKISFDQTSKLLENFEQLKMSSEFRSNDPLSLEWLRDKRVEQHLGEEIFLRLVNKKNKKNNKR
jgi:hypothetical protein